GRYGHLRAGRQRPAVDRQGEGSAQGAAVGRGGSGMNTFLRGAALASAATVLLLAGSPVASPLPEAATAIESIRAQHTGTRTTVTLRGDGQLTPANVEETAEPPRRLV